jgi:hypothetical protein
MMRVAPLAVLATALPLAAAAAQNSFAHPARIVGAIADSVSGGPLQGADVVASGVAVPVKTDSLGRFTIDGLAPGTYQVGVFHPLLESLGITLATKPFVVGPDSAGVVNLAVPSVPTLVRRYCPTEQTTATPAAIAGRVLDPDDDEPIPGAKVTLAWTELFVSKTTGVVRTPHELHVDTNASGFFKVCGLPSDLDGTLQVNRGDATTPEIPVTMNGALLDFQSVAIPAHGEAKKVGVVTGHVLSPLGKPVGGARVEIPMSSVSTTTRDDGTFRLVGVLAGTQMLVARSLSYATAAEPINVTSREPLDVTLTVGNKVNLLDPVLVTARRDYALDKAGFTARKRAGAGYFFTREDIDRRQPNNITDMIKGLPSVTVSYQRGGTVVRGRGGVTSLYSASAPCTRVFIDGFEWRDLQPGDLDMFVNPDDVIGLEVYQSGDVPNQFRRLDRGCLTMVVWTQFRGKASK